MRLLTYMDYVDYIKKHPLCTTEDIKKGKLVDASLDTILLGIIKYMLQYCTEESLLIYPPVMMIRDIVVTKQV